LNQGKGAKTLAKIWKTVRAVEPLPDLCQALDDLKEATTPP